MDTKIELNDQELKQVCGGFSEQNGLYSLRKNDFFVKDSGDEKQTWSILEDYTNITLDTPVSYYWTREVNGMFNDMKQGSGTLRDLLIVRHAEFVGND